MTGRKLGVCAAIIAVSACGKMEQPVTRLELTGSVQNALGVSYIVFHVRNDGPETICLPYAQFHLDRPNLRLAGIDGERPSGNGPPETFLGDVEITEGLMVLQAQKRSGYTVEVGLTKDVPSAGLSVLGDLKYISCEALFTQPAPKALRAPVEVDLN